jgi:hypothetical protein
MTRRTRRRLPNDATNEGTGPPVPFRVGPSSYSTTEPATWLIVCTSLRMSLGLVANGSITDWVQLRHALAQVDASAVLMVPRLNQLSA